MQPSRRAVLAVTLSLASVALVGAGRLAASEKNAEGSVTIKFPREETARVDLKCGKVDFRSVKLEGAPSRHEIHEARHHKDDSSKLRWIFKLGNEGKHSRKVTMQVKVYGVGKELLAEDSRTDTVSGEKDKDQISVWTEIRTRDYPKADHVHISAECERE